MRYKTDYTDKVQETAAEQYMPPCGAFNAGLAPANLSNWIPKNQIVMGVGAEQPTTVMPSAYIPTTPMPTGYPTGGTTSPLLPTVSGQPSTLPAQGMQGFQGVQGMQQGQVPATVESTFYTPGFLRTQIGKKMRVEFLIGTNGFTDRTGTLVAVGASYILLRPVDSDDIILCDIYSIKFVTIIR